MGDKGFDSQDITDNDLICAAKAERRALAGRLFVLQSAGLLLVLVSAVMIPTLAGALVGIKGLLLLLLVTHLAGALFAAIASICFALAKG